MKKLADFTPRSVDRSWTETNEIVQKARASAAKKSIQDRFSFESYKDGVGWTVTPEWRDHLSRLPVRGEKETSSARYWNRHRIPGEKMVREWKDIPRGKDNLISAMEALGRNIGLEEEELLLSRVSTEAWRSGLIRKRLPTDWLSPLPKYLMAQAAAKAEEAEQAGRDEGNRRRRVVSPNNATRWMVKTLLEVSRARGKAKRIVRGADLWGVLKGKVTPAVAGRILKALGFESFRKGKHTFYIIQRKLVVKAARWLESEEAAQPYLFAPEPRPKRGVVPILINIARRVRDSNAGLYETIRKHLSEGSAAACAGFHKDILGKPAPT